MRKSNLLAGCGLVLLIGGCTSVQYTQFPVTRYAEIALRDDATIRIEVRCSEEISSAVKAALSEELTKTGKFKVVDGSADYWLVVDCCRQYKHKALMTSYEVRKDENEYGGRDVLAPIAVNTASVAHNASIVLYEATSLTPLHYAEIPFCDGERAVDEDVQEEDKYLGRFVARVTSEIGKSLVTQDVKVTIPIPKKTDPKLVAAYMAGNLEAILNRYGGGADEQFLKLMDSIRKDSYEGEDLDVELAGHYMRLLAEERKTTDPEILKRIRDRQFQLLQVAEDDGVTEAVSTALARLDRKLFRLGSL